MGQKDLVSSLIQVLSEYVGPEFMLGQPVDRETFERALVHPAVNLFLQKLDIDLRVAQEYDLFGLIDEDESESLDLGEIAHTMMRLIGNARALDVARLHRDIVGVAQKLQDYEEQVCSLVHQVQTNQSELVFRMTYQTDASASKEAAQIRYSKDEPVDIRGAPIYRDVARILGEDVASAAHLPINRKLLSLGS